MVHHLRTTGWVLLVTLGLSQPAWGDLPASQFITYRTREIPTDPQSAVVLQVTFRLTAVAATAVEVGWAVDEISIVRPGNESSPDQLWIDLSPELLTSDGLWWVAHEDLLQPQFDEFAVPPALVGTALATAETDDDLGYFLEGAMYVPPPEGAPYEHTVALSYSFQLLAAQEPIDEDVIVPTESGTLRDSA